MLSDFQPSVNAEYRVRIENPDGEAIVLKLADASMALERTVSPMIHETRPRVTVSGIIAESDNDTVMKGARGGVVDG